MCDVITFPRGLGCLLSVCVSCCLAFDLSISAHLRGQFALVYEYESYSFYSYGSAKCENFRLRVQADNVEWVRNLSSDDSETVRADWFTKFSKFCKYTPRGCHNTVRSARTVVPVPKIFVILQHQNHISLPVTQRSLTSQELEENSDTISLDSPSCLDSKKVWV